MSNIENEQQYIELTEQLKESYDLYEKQNKELINEMNDLKKDIMCIYGLIRTTDNYISNIILDDNSNQILEFLIESIRSLCNGIIDAHILE